VIGMSDGRIAVGARGVPYLFGSAMDRNGAPDAETIRRLTEILHRHFPATIPFGVDHAWCGVMGVPRDWCATVGLDPTTNLLNPMMPSDSALLNKSEMWFNNTAQPDGYIFMNVQGKIDTSANRNKPLVPFSYKIGTNAHFVQVNMGDKNFTLEEGKSIFGHLWIDYSKLFNGIPLNLAPNLSVKTVQDNSSALAAKIANNIPSMFIYE
ncbi:MAG: hypothetical protein RIS64_3852, partial [Bacteroidota bacterium]